MRARTLLLLLCLLAPAALGAPPAREGSPDVGAPACLGTAVDPDEVRVRACGLDADYLDGKDAADFADAAHHHDGRYYLAGAPVSDSLRLGGQTAGAFAPAGHDHHDLYYLAGSRVADSALLDGEPASSFSRADHHHDLRYYLAGAAVADSLLLEGKPAGAFASSGHDHDADYYARGEAVEDARLLQGRPAAAFAPSAHAHDDRYASRSEASDTFLTKGETAVNAERLGGRPASDFSASLHDHDARYHTKAEVDARVPPAAGSPILASKVVLVHPGETKDISTASSIWNPMPEMALSFSTGDEVVRLDFQASLCGVVSGPGGNGRGHYRLLLDGTAVAYAMTWAPQSTGTWGIVTMSAVAPLAPGSHTAVVEWRRAEVANYLQCHAFAPYGDVGMRSLVAARL